MVYGCEMQKLDSRRESQQFIHPSYGYDVGEHKKRREMVMVLGASESGFRWLSFF